MLARQFKRGIYKIFLEERSLSIGDAYDEKFNFIREFARYNLIDYPVYYYHQRIPGVFISLLDFQEPCLKFTENNEDTIKSFGIYEFYLLGHWFSIPTYRNYKITWDLYFKNLVKKHDKVFSSIQEIKYINDIDFTFSERIKG